MYASRTEPIKKGNKNKRNYGYDYYALCWLATKEIKTQLKHRLKAIA